MLKLHSRPIAPVATVFADAGDLRGVVEKVWGLGQHVITSIVRRSIMAVQPNSMTSEVV